MFASSESPLAWYGISCRSTVVAMAAVGGICCLIVRCKPPATHGYPLSSPTRTEIAVGVADMPSSTAVVARQNSGVHILMNKPPCCLVSTVDEQPRATRKSKLKRQRALSGAGPESQPATGGQRETVVDVLRANGFDPKTTSAVGRLDFESTGVLFFTSDGELNRAVRAKDARCTKVYHVYLAGKWSAADTAVQRLTEPLWFPEPNLPNGGVWTAPAELRWLREEPLDGEALAADPWPWPPHGGWSTVIEVKIFEGRNRQIRRLCARSRLHIRRLHRVKFGPLELGNLETGRCRMVTRDELAALRDAAGKAC